MARVLTGIQTASAHPGTARTSENILGAIKPAIELANEGCSNALRIICFLFIADLHSLTQIKDGATLRENTYAVAATWMAFGLDTERTVFYRQSDVPECTELAWYLQCHFPYSRMTLAHSFKDKQDRLGDVNAGLFAYPMLMAADILLYDADLVPVGKDQMQHLEMTRDVASRFNHAMGETFVLPEAMTGSDDVRAPGLDGNKMSKSRDNTLNIFDDPKALKKAHQQEIVTDATPLEDPKDPEANVTHSLYRLVANEAQADEIASIESRRARLGSHGPSRGPCGRLRRGARALPRAHGRQGPNRRSPRQGAEKSPPSQPTCWPAFASAPATDSRPQFLLLIRSRLSSTSGSVLRLELPVELTLAVVEVNFAALNPYMRQAVGTHVEGVAFRQEQRGRFAALQSSPASSSMPRIRAGLRVNAWMACSSVRPYARAVPA